MSEDEYTRLMESVLDFVKSKGTVKYEELMEWAEKEGFSRIAVKVVLNSLIQEEKLYAPDGFKEAEIDTPWIPTPVTVSVERKKEEVKIEEKVEEVEVKQKVKEELEASKVRKIEAKEAPQEVKQKVKESVAGEARKEGSFLEDRELIEKYAKEQGIPVEWVYKALNYLALYHSVGFDRFKRDAKNLGIGDPIKVLRVLYKTEYIDYHDIGIVNATEKTLKLKKKMTIDMLFNFAS